MSQLDIYAPPTASMAGPTPAELNAKANGELVLAGIGQRIGAAVIDCLFLIPFYAADAYFGGLSGSAAIAMTWAIVLAAMFMYVVMTRVFGGTPGKLLVGIRVTKADGARLTWKAAALRYSVFFAGAVATAVGTAMAVLSMPDDSYLGQGYVMRHVLVSAKEPEWVSPLSYLMVAWVFACLISLMVTKRRRSLCDFQAGTIVVRAG